MKRTILWLLVLLILFPLALTGAERRESEEIVLTAMVRDYSLNYDTPWFTAAEKFSEKYPHVRIEFEGLPYNDQREKVLITVGAERGPDIVMVDCIWLGEFASNNILIDLTSRISAVPGLRDDYIESFQQSSKWNGIEYGLWLWTDVRMLSYNKDLFRAAGLDPNKPPATWAELRDYAKKLTNPATGVWGYAFPAFSTDHTADRWYPFLYMAGGQILSDDYTRAAFNSEAGVQALQLLVDLMRNDKVSPTDLLGISESDVSNGFFTEKYAMQIKVGEFWADFRDKGGLTFDEYKNKIGVAPLPVPPGGSIATGSGGWLAAITRDSKHPDLAFEYITMVVETYNMTEFLIKQGAIPTRKSMLALEDRFLSAVPYFNVAAEVLPHTQFRPPIPEYSQISSEIVFAIQSALTGRAAPKAALDLAAQRVNAILDQRKW